MTQLRSPRRRDFKRSRAATSPPARAALRTAIARAQVALEGGASIPEADALVRALLASWRRHPANHR